jgi:hypothetical protein
VAAKRGGDGVRLRPGPKPKPIETQRRNRLMLNLNDEEFAQLTKAAGGESAASFARSIVLRYLARRPR